MSDLIQNKPIVVEILYKDNTFDKLEIADFMALEEVECRAIRILDVAYQINKLPTLLEGMEELHWHGGGLEELPTLPSTLKKLDIRGSRFIKEIPELPSGLEVLRCCYTNITELPKLPPDLRQVDCRNCNGLTKLPPLPSHADFEILASSNSWDENYIDWHNMKYDNDYKMKR